MNKKSEIVKVVVKIKDVEVSMSIEELKHLRCVLNDLLGSKDYVYIPPYYPRPYWDIWYSTSDSTAVVSRVEQ